LVSGERSACPAGSLGIFLGCLCKTRSASRERSRLVTRSGETCLVSPWGVAHNGCDGPAVRGLTRLSMWPERTDARVGVLRDGNQLHHSHWGPEVEQPKWCRPSGNGCGGLHYLTRSENLRLVDGCDVVLAGEAGDACLRSKPGDTWGERFLPGP
jgi:hypothetical protein